MSLQNNNFEYIETSLFNHSHLLDETLKLIEESFNYFPLGKYHYIEDFYPLFSSSNRKGNHLLLDSKSSKVIGHIGVLKRFLLVNNHLIPIALIGGISIHPDFRKKGLFSVFFNHVLKYYQDQVAFMTLWSSETSLYSKFGFYEAGIQIQVGNNPFELSQIDQSNFKLIKTKIINVDETTLNTIKKIYQEYVLKKNYISVYRSDDDWASLSKISSSDLYLAMQKENIIGYFVVNKGMDLQNIIHEFACVIENEDLFFNSLSKFKFWVPYFQELFNSIFNKYDSSFLFQASFKIGNLPLLDNFLYHWTKNKLSISPDGFLLSNLKTMEKGLSVRDKKFWPSLFGPNYLNYSFSSFQSIHFSGLDSI